MNEIKRQLDKKMGDTSARSAKVRAMVEHNKQRTNKKSTMPYYVTFVAFLALLTVVLYMNPFETKAPTTSTPAPTEQQEPSKNHLKKFFKENGDVAYFQGMYNEYATFTETTTWLNEDYVQITVDNGGMEVRKFYKITQDAIYLVYEDKPEIDGVIELTVEQLQKMEPISTMLVANYKETTEINDQLLITYPAQLKTPLQQFENVIQITEENDYGKVDYYYAENFGLVGQISTTDGYQVFSLLTSINSKPTFGNFKLPVVNQATNEKETLVFSEGSISNPILTSHPDYTESTVTYTPLHSASNEELGLVEINLPQDYSSLLVIRTGNSVKHIAMNTSKLVDWSYSPNKERIAVYYSNGHDWKNADDYNMDSIIVINLAYMSAESSTNDYEMNWYAYPILSYKWLDDSTIECVVPEVNSPLPQLFAEWMNSENQPTTTVLAEFE